MAWCDGNWSFCRYTWKVLVNIYNVKNKWNNTWLVLVFSSILRYKKWEINNEVIQISKTNFALYLIVNLKTTSLILMVELLRVIISILVIILSIISISRKFIFAWFGVPPSMGSTFPCDCLAGQNPGKPTKPCVLKREALPHGRKPSVLKREAIPHGRKTFVLKREAIPHGRKPFVLKPP